VPNIAAQEASIPCVGTHTFYHCYVVWIEIDRRERAAADVIDAKMVHVAESDFVLVEVFHRLNEILHFDRRVLPRPNTCPEKVSVESSLELLRSTHVELPVNEKQHIQEVFFRVDGEAFLRFTEEELFDGFVGRQGNGVSTHDDVRIVSGI
jgi:hypothetical protein